jgi:hypothetical protein
MNTKNYSLGDLADSLATASKISKELGIDISGIGVWRRVVIANALGHELVRNIDDNLLDATKEGVEYSYIAAHYGKRAQLFLGLSTLSKPRKNHTFIVVFSLKLIVPKFFRCGVVIPIPFGKKQTDNYPIKYLNLRPSQNHSWLISLKSGLNPKKAKAQN